MAKKKKKKKNYTAFWIIGALAAGAIGWGLASGGKGGTDDYEVVETEAPYDGPVYTGPDADPETQLPTTTPGWINFQKINPDGYWQAVTTIMEETDFQNVEIPLPDFQFTNLTGLGNSKNCDYGT